MIYKNLIALALGLAALASSPAFSASSSALSSATPPTVQIRDFGDPGLTSFTQKLERRLQGEALRIRISQFGDSHTAADLWTHRLRQLLQARYGDAGIGWVTPGPVAGQRHSLVKLNPLGQGWIARSSRLNPGPFPLGGYRGSLENPHAEAGFSVRLKHPSLNELWKVRYWLEESSKEAAISGPALRLDQATTTLFLTPAPLSSTATLENPWRSSDVLLEMDNGEFNIVAPEQTTARLGGLSLERLSPGIMVDSFGTNGAQQGLWEQWSGAAPAMLRDLSPDLVILAYGVNEAFDPRFDLKGYESKLVNAIRTIREAVPTAAVLVVGAPDAGSNRQPRLRHALGCHQPLWLESVQRTQRRIAAREKTLFWDWEEAMGGACSMRRWVKEKLAMPDFVHFSHAGYERIGTLMFEALTALVSKK